MYKEMERRMEKDLKDLFKSLMSESLGLDKDDPSIEAVYEKENKRSLQVGCVPLNIRECLKIKVVEEYKSRVISMLNDRGADEEIMHSIKKSYEMPDVVEVVSESGFSYQEQRDLIVESILKVLEEVGGSPEGQIRTLMCWFLV